MKVHFGYLEPVGRNTNAIRSGYNPNAFHPSASIPSASIPSVSIPSAPNASDPLIGIQRHWWDDCRCGSIPSASFRMEVCTRQSNNVQINATWIRIILFDNKRIQTCPRIISELKTEKLLMLACKCSCAYFFMYKNTKNLITYLLFSRGPAVFNCNQVQRC